MTVPWLENEKQCSIKVIGVPIIVGTHGNVPKSLELNLDDLETRNKK